MTLLLDQRDVDQTIDNFAQLASATRNRIIRVAINAAGGVLKLAQIAAAPEETKLLKKSLIVKAKVPSASRNAKHHDRPAYVVVGPNKATVGPAIRKAGRSKTISIKRATKLVLGGGTVMVRKPSRYAHLAEKHKSFVGESISGSGQAALDAMQRKLAEGINTEAAKLAAKA